MDQLIHYNYLGQEYIPSINFLYPCTMSFPAIFTKENLSCFPIFTT